MSKEEQSVHMPYGACRDPPFPHRQAPPLGNNGNGYPSLGSQYHGRRSLMRLFICLEIHSHLCGWLVRLGRPTQTLQLHEQKQRWLSDC